MYIAHTTARFCTHATRGEAQDNMHSLFGVALHRARVLGAALVESTEQAPQGAKAPGVHGRAARRFEVPTIEVPTIEVPASEVPANEAWSSRAPMRVAPSSVVPASVVPLWSTTGRARQRPGSSANTTCACEQSWCGRVAHRRPSLCTHRACQLLRSCAHLEFCFVAGDLVERGSGRSNRSCAQGTALVRRCGSRQ